MRKKKIPHFKSEGEEARFWDTHSPLDYEFEEVDEVFVLSPELAKRIRERARKKPISIRLPRWEIDKTKQMAQKRGLPYQTLIQHWIYEGLVRDAKPGAKYGTKSKAGGRKT